MAKVGNKGPVPDPGLTAWGEGGPRIVTAAIRLRVMGRFPVRAPVKASVLKGLAMDPVPANKAPEGVPVPATANATALSAPDKDSAPVSPTVRNSPGRRAGNATRRSKRHAPRL